jgi:WD40 repeat protein
MAAELSLDRMTTQSGSGSYDNTVRIWNATTGEVEAELKGHTGSVRSVAFAQDGSRVVSGSNDKTVRIWNATTGEVEAELKGHTDSVMSVAFAQDGSRVVSGSYDKTVRIWNATTGEVEAELKGHTDLVTSVAFAQDGSRVVSGSNDNTVRIWNTATGESQLMTASTITLPDASIVHNEGYGDFHISYPEQPTLSIHAPLSISDDGKWIVGALRDCWIPSYDRDFISSSFSGNRACFGYHSGRVIIFDMKAAP